MEGDEMVIIEGNYYSEVTQQVRFFDTSTNRLKPARLLIANVACGRCLIECEKV